MMVHLFGATSSPGCTTFGLRHLAEMHQNSQPAAAQFIKHSFYVDDGLMSVNTETETTALVKEATDLCKKGNIRLHKFTSNSREVLKAVPETERSDSSKENSYKYVYSPRKSRWCTWVHQS